MEKVTVEKFALGVRATHWLHGALIIGFLITGYGIFSKTYLFGDYATNLALHMIMAFIILMNGLWHIYFMTVTGEPRSIWISLDDIKDIIKIAKNFLGISKEYPEYGTYDVKAKRFYGKYHPVIKIKYWGDLWFLGFAAISGFSLYYVPVFNYVNFYANLMGLNITLLWFRAIHIIVFLYFFCVLMFHVYLALIPVNRELLNSMITGKENAEVHESETPYLNTGTKGTGDLEQKIVIIGVGNLLMGDDGIGIHVVESLRKEKLPENVHVFDAETRAFDVLEYMDGSDKTVIVDACKKGGAPGSIYRFTFDPAGEIDESMNLSLHDINFIDALRAGRDVYKLPKEIVIIGVEPDGLDWGIGLSQKINNCFKEIIEAVKSEMF